MKDCRLCHHPIMNFVSKQGICQSCWTEEVLVRYPQAIVHTLTPTPFEPAMDNGTEHTEYGICDECGEPSDRLLRFNHKWICEDCMEEKE